MKGVSVPVPEKEKMDAVLDSMITLCDVMGRQVLAMMNICKALRSDGAATFTLPDPPAHLLEKMDALKPKADPDT